MPIVCIEFEGGLHIRGGADTVELETAMGLMNDEVPKKAYLLTPGIHNLTPGEWKDPNYEYWVKVEENLAGKMIMRPRVEGAASRFMEEREWTEGSRTVELNNESSERITIAGGHKESPSGLGVYKLIYFISADK